MRLLLDACVWGGALPELVAAGHDAVWAGEWDRDPGDDEILRLAHADDRVLVTLDKDFGELVVLHRRPHSGIIRLVNWPAIQQARICQRILQGYADELRQGALLTAELGRVRIRL